MCIELTWRPFLLLLVAVVVVVVVVVVDVVVVVVFVVVVVVVGFTRMEIILPQMTKHSFKIIVGNNA